MISTCQPALLESLRLLAHLYPDMRFGQLLLMGAVLASETTLRAVSQVSDDELARSLAKHIQGRRQVRDALADPPTPLDEDKEQLLRRLEVRLPSLPQSLGQTMTVLSQGLGFSLYDVEDNDLIAALDHQ